jgi:cell fate (sporulation/competence/biofilm development) regulator YlbF (YheA/YmcA/DUF963 family)
MDMDIERQTRQLGAALQLEPPYVRFVAAKEVNEADQALAGQMRETELLRQAYRHEAAKGEAADKTRMEAYNAQFQALLAKLRQNPKMIEYEAAAEGLDKLLKRITGILSGCAMGEDPASYEPQAKGCGGDCAGGCGGGCHSRGAC